MVNPLPGYRRKTRYPHVAVHLSLSVRHSSRRRLRLRGFCFRSTTGNRYVSILFNQRTRLVDDVIEGTIVASPWNNLARLESDPAIRVVVRRDLNKAMSPSSPAAAPAMSRPTSGLSARDAHRRGVRRYFASPSVDAVLTAIQAVTGEAGCLLIVKTIPAIALTLVSPQRKHVAGLQRRNADCRRRYFVAG